MGSHAIAIPAIHYFPVSASGRFSLLSAGKVPLQWPRILAGAPRRHGDHSREPRAEPHPRAGPGHPREPGADSTAFLDLSATVPAGKGRVRSLNYLHLTQTDRTPAVTVHMRTGTGTGGYPGAGRPRSATRMDRRPPGSPPGGIAGHSQGCLRTWSPLLTGPAGTLPFSGSPATVASALPERTAIKGDGQPSAPRRVLRGQRRIRFASGAGD